MIVSFVVTIDGKQQFFGGTMTREAASLDACRARSRARFESTARQLKQLLGRKPDQLGAVVDCIDTEQTTSFVIGDDIRFTQAD